jgi:hypothetical protein
MFYTLYYIDFSRKTTIFLSLMFSLDDFFTLFLINFVPST